jgi:hypothetical protein
MSKITLIVVVVLGLIVLGCSPINRTELVPIVARDSVPFDLELIPAEVIDRLSDYQVIIVGETHLIREQQQFTAGLIRALHAEGYRQLLLEWPHLADWVLSEYAVDGVRRPEWWEPPINMLGDLITTIRNFNLTLPENERIAVRAIDMNLDEYGGADQFFSSLGGVSQQLPDPGPLETFLQNDYGTSNAQEIALMTLQQDLNNRRSELVELWGKKWYETVLEMVEVESDSIPIRNARVDNYDSSVRLREDVIKKLCDRRIVSIENGTVIHIGANHAQKERFKGTSQEWLGDYLVNRSTAINGRVFVMSVVPSRITADFDTDLPDFDLLDASPENELFRIISETWPERVVFLPFDDPIFVTTSVSMNYEGKIYVATPKRHYDAVVVLPVAYRIQLIEERD